MKSTLQLFSEKQQSLAHFAGALAHPARIAIIGILQRSGEVSCGKLVQELPLAQSTVSQHLRCLREAGLLVVCEYGPSVCYSLDIEQLRAFCHSFQCTLGTDEGVHDEVGSTTQPQQF